MRRHERRIVWARRIGKSRVVREIAAIAATRGGVQVFRARCESIAKEVPFHVVAQLLRAVMKVGDSESSSDREQLKRQLPDVGNDDLLLLGDLLGINDPTWSSRHSIQMPDAGD